MLFFLHLFFLLFSSPLFFPFCNTFFPPVFSDTQFFSSLYTRQTAAMCFSTWFTKCSQCIWAHYFKMGTLKKGTYLNLDGYKKLLDTTPHLSILCSRKNEGVPAIEPQRQAQSKDKDIMYKELGNWVSGPWNSRERETNLSFRRLTSIVGHWLIHILFPQ